MAILFSCPCGRKLQVADELAGKPVRCPACYQVSNATAPSAEPQRPMATLVPDPPATSPKARPARRPLVTPEALNARDSRCATACFSVAAVSGFVGLFTLLLTVAWIPGGVLSIVLGVIALVRIASSKGGLRGRGRAWIGIVLGTVLLSFSVLLLVLEHQYRLIIFDTQPLCEGLLRPGSYDCGN